MTRKFLDNVYDHIGDGVAAFYDDWAATYEAEIAENGYATPGRCAQALAQCLKDPAAPVLDVGCGTGLSGLALRAEGFNTLDGVDVSAEMLAKAREKAIYRNLSLSEAGGPLPGQTGYYRAITTIGVIGPGAAPLELLDSLVAHLGKGGLICLSFNDHALEDPAYGDKLSMLCAQGILTERFREHGPHLPERNINSTVYVFEKL